MTLVFVESTVRLRQLTSCLGVYPGVQFCTRCTVLLRRKGKGKKRKKGKGEVKGKNFVQLTFFLRGVSAPLPPEAKIILKI